MSCCGQKRTDLRIAKGESITGRPAGEVKVAYLGPNSFSVKGSFTGRSYTFSPEERVTSVDANDSRVMLKTRFFRRV